MVQMNQKWDKILELLFEYPNQILSIRQIAKRTGIPSSSVQRYLEKLRRENVIDSENKMVVNSYTKFLKSFFMVDKIYRAGLVDYLKEHLNPSVIIVFGSVQKGEYDCESDIDLFVESSVKKELDFKNFEKKLNHKIQLFLYPNMDKLQPHLFNNIVNGIKLYGYFKIK